MQMLPIFLKNILQSVTRALSCAMYFLEDIHPIGAQGSGSCRNLCMPHITVLPHNLKGPTLWKKIRRIFSSLKGWWLIKMYNFQFFPFFPLFTQQYIFS